MGKPRKPRLTSGETFQFVRDEKTGETMVRCLFCEASPYPFKEALRHVCKPEEVKPTEDPFRRAADGR